MEKEKKVNPQSPIEKINPDVTCHLGNSLCLMGWNENWVGQEARSVILTEVPPHGNRRQMERGSPSEAQTIETNNSTDIKRLKGCNHF